MQTYSANSNTEYFPQDDESEANRLAQLNGGVVAGVGDVHYMDDDDVKQYSIRDFGMGFDR